MLVMGLDTSTTSTGWCVLDKEVDKIVAKGSIRPNKALSTLKRIDYIYEEIKALFDKYEPEYVIIEEMTVCRNMQTMRSLIGLLYYVMIRLEKRGAIVHTVRPTEWRKNKIKGKYREDLKKNAMLYVNKKYGIKVNDDEADSILIAEYDVQGE